MQREKGISCSHNCLTKITLLEITFLVASTDLMPVVEPPVEPPAPLTLTVDLQGAEGGADTTPNAPPAEDEDKLVLWFIILYCKFLYSSSISK